MTSGPRHRMAGFTRPILAPGPLAFGAVYGLPLGKRDEPPPILLACLSKVLPRFPFSPCCDVGGLRGSAGGGSKQTLAVLSRERKGSLASFQEMSHRPLFIMLGTFRKDKRQRDKLQTQTQRSS